MKRSAIRRARGAAKVFKFCIYQGLVEMAGFSPASPQFYTVAEVADIMRVSRMTVYRMVHSGELPAIRVGKNSYRVPRSALDQLLMVGFQEENERRIAGA